MSLNVGLEKVFCPSGLRKFCFDEKTAMEVFVPPTSPANIIFE